MTVGGVVFLVVVAGLVGLIIAGYNKLVGLRQRSDEAWSDIDVQLKRRTDLVPNLVETVKGYAAHERTTLDAVTRARGAAVAAQTPETRAQAENALTGALRQLFALAEAYPDLKANANFIQLQGSLSEIEDAIQSARRYYNAVVRDLNTSVQTFPSNFVASFFQFHPRGTSSSIARRSGRRPASRSGAERYKPSARRARDPARGGAVARGGGGARVRDRELRHEPPGQPRREPPRPRGRHLRVPGRAPGRLPHDPRALRPGRPGVRAAPGRHRRLRRGEPPPPPRGLLSEPLRADHGVGTRRHRHEEDRDVHLPGAARDPRVRGPRGALLERDRPRVGGPDPARRGGRPHAAGCQRQGRPHRRLHGATGRRRAGLQSGPRAAPPAPDRDPAPEAARGHDSGRRLAARQRRPPDGARRGPLVRERQLALQLAAPRVRPRLARLVGVRT